MKCAALKHRLVATVISLESEFHGQRYCALLAHLEVEIVAKNRSTVVWSIPFQRFPKRNHVNPCPAFNVEFIVRHICSFPNHNLRSPRQTLHEHGLRLKPLTLSGPI